MSQSTFTFGGPAIKQYLVSILLPSIFILFQPAANAQDQQAQEKKANQEEMREKKTEKKEKHEAMKESHGEKKEKNRS